MKKENRRGGGGGKKIYERGGEDLHFPILILKGGKKGRGIKTYSFRKRSEIPYDGLSAGKRREEGGPPS